MTTPSSLPDPENTAFRVAVFAKPEDPEELVELLMQVLELNRVDARIQTRHLPGLLPERLKKWQASSLVEVLFKHGISSAAFAESEVPSLARPCVVHRAECHVDGLEIDGLHGAEIDRVAWHDVSLLSIGEIPQDAPYHTTTPRMVAASSGGRTEDTSGPTVSFHSPELWLIARRPERVLRIDSRQMNYEYLAHRKTESSAVNFRHFVDDITAHSPDAWLTPSTRAWLKHESQFQFQFADTESLRHATLTGLLMRRAFDRDAGNSTGTAPV